MRDIIIRNKSDLPHEEVMRCVSAVIAMGRVSGKGMSYCYESTFRGGITVLAKCKLQSDIFIVSKVS